jgi:Ca2+-binding RTX toxin-like protein
MKKSWVATRDFVELPGRVNGTKWDDTFVGDQGDTKNVDVADKYDGRGGNDTIYGLDEADRLWGSGGDDLIYGGRGTDTISGGPGDDTLWGGMHTDIIRGGDGADDFLFTAWRDTEGFTGSGEDIIADFNPRQRDERISIESAHYEGITTFADLKSRMVQQGDDVNIEFDGGHAMLVLKHVKIAELHADDFNIYFG